MQGPEQVYDDELLFNWQNVFWGANLKLAQLKVHPAFLLWLYLDAQGRQRCGGGVSAALLRRLKDQCNTPHIALTALLPESTPGTQAVFVHRTSQPRFTR